MMVRKSKIRLLLMLLGATSFWGAPIVIAIMTRKEVSILVGTSLSTSIFLLVHDVMRRRSAGPVRSQTLWMLWGVFLLGGVFSSIAFTAMGAGFSELGVWEATRMLLISFIPGWIALYGSVGMGTLPGLLLVTIITAWIHDRKRQSQKREGTLEN